MCYLYIQIGIEISYKIANFGKKTHYGEIKSAVKKYKNKTKRKKIMKTKTQFTIQIFIYINNTHTYTQNCNRRPANLLVLDG